MEDKLIKQMLFSAKTIAMVGVSQVKNEDLNNVKRRPSVIVMQYLQEFGYRVIPVNPFALGKKICGEEVVAKLKDIKIPVDIVDIFRPSVEVPLFAEQTVDIKAKVLWLQYGISSSKAEEIVKKGKIEYISNKCIKQEYQRLFLKISPVFPALKN